MRTHSVTDPPADLIAPTHVRTAMLAALEADCNGGADEHAQERSADRESRLVELLRKQRVLILDQRRMIQRLRAGMLAQSAELGRRAE